MGINVKPCLLYLCLSAMEIRLLLSVFSHCRKRGYVGIRRKETLLKVLHGVVEELKLRIKDVF